MDIKLSNSEIKSIWRLGRCLESGIVHVNDLRDLLTGLQRKISNDTAVPVGRKARGVKEMRKDKFKAMLRN